jgi:hypothetical protein
MYYFAPSDSEGFSTFGDCSTSEEPQDIADESSRRLVINPHITSDLAGGDAKDTLSSKGVGAALSLSPFVREDQNAKHHDDEESDQAVCQCSCERRSCTLHLE